MQEERNLGGQPTPDGRTGSGAGPTNSQDERTWSIIAHLSVLAALVGLMPLGALIVWHQVGQGVDYRYPFIADRVDGGASRVL
jgi:hypothetical protein